MRRLIKILLSHFIILSMSCSYISSTSLIAYAHSEGPPHEENQAVQQKTAEAALSYSFTAPPGCSLSLLARRSIQLFDQETQAVAMTPAQAMYAETNIVKHLGERWLEIGEKVSIDKAVVEDYSKKSQSLTPAEVAAWQFYADQANFNVDDIKAETPTTTVSGQPNSQTVTNESEQKPSSQAPEARSSSPAWYLWLIVGAALGGMYYMLDRPRKK